MTAPTRAMARHSRQPASVERPLSPQLAPVRDVGRSAVGIARLAVGELHDALGLATIAAARPGAVGLLTPPVLLRTADGWVHPGPPTAWADVIVMLRSLLGDHAGESPLRAATFPDLSSLNAEVIDAEAGAWMLPAVAVRAARATAPTVAWPRAAIDVRGARVVVLGSAWAAPLAGLALQRLGANVARVVDPRRADPFPLRDDLSQGQRVVALDLRTDQGLDSFARLLADTDLLVDGTTPRVLRNAGFDDVTVPIVRIAAFAHEDRPGYGLAAEARGGWAVRHDPPQLGRSSVADPVAGLLAALLAVDVLRSSTPGSRARISLEEAVGHLFAVEHGHSEPGRG
jgi:hypothetical protein